MAVLPMLMVYHGSWRHRLVPYPVAQRTTVQWIGVVVVVVVVVVWWEWLESRGS